MCLRLSSCTTTLFNVLYLLDIVRNSCKSKLGPLTLDKSQYKVGFTKSKSCRWYFKVKGRKKINDMSFPTGFENS